MSEDLGWATYKRKNGARERKKDGCTSISMCNDPLTILPLIFLPNDLKRNSWQKEKWAHLTVWHEYNTSEILLKALYRAGFLVSSFKTDRKEWVWDYYTVLLKKNNTILFKLRIEIYLFRPLHFKYRYFKSSHKCANLFLKLKNIL